jgi:hypothetical protein
MIGDIVRPNMCSFYRSTSPLLSSPMDDLRSRWSRPHFSHVRSSPTKWCAKHGPIILNAADRFVGLQQFVLLIQQVQAPEDLATLPPLPNLQTTPIAQSPTPPANTTNTSSTNMPTNGRGANASSMPLLPTTSPQQVSGQGVSWLVVLRLVLQFVWYDEHNRICTLASLLSLPPLD